MTETLSIVEYRQIARKPRKYRNEPKTADGFRFDSRKEARRYRELRLLQQAGEISRLEVHPCFELKVYGTPVGKYTGDFAYAERGEYIVEDCKSPATRREAAYRLRRRLMKAIHGIEVREV